MEKLLLLDLFSGAGGAAQGYYDAGFEVVGVDIAPQPHYPFTFIQADVFDYLAQEDITRYAVIHASPPCQKFSFATGFHPDARSRYEDHITSLRPHLEYVGRPYVIENVAGAPLQCPIKLCGTMFGLRVIRHRYFECNVVIPVPRDRCRTMGIKVAKPGAIPRGNEYWCVGGHFGKKYDAARALGIDWMHTQREISEAIPPVYTAYIGMQLRQRLETGRSTYGNRTLHCSG